MEFSKRLFSGHLDDGEKICEIIHRHVLVLKLTSWKSLAFGMIPPILLTLIFPQLILFWGIWFFGGILSFIYYFIDWYFDAWLLTNNGVIDVERNGLFDRSSTRIDYHMIEGISYNIAGILPTLFNYGDITIDKMGSKTSVVLKDAANPQKVERRVGHYQEKFVNSKSIRDHNALKNMLSEMIAYHVQNNKINVEE